MAFATGSQPLRNIPKYLNLTWQLYFMIVFVAVFCMFVISFLSVVGRVDPFRTQIRPFWTQIWPFPNVCQVRFYYPAVRGQLWPARTRHGRPWLIRAPGSTARTPRKLCKKLFSEAPESMVKKWSFDGSGPPQKMCPKSGQKMVPAKTWDHSNTCLLYTSPSPRD